MFKFLKFIVSVLVIVILFSLIADHQTLKNEVIRLHVVANSNTEEDQQVKISVKDAILEYLNETTLDMSDVQAVKEYLQTHLSEINQVVQEKLKELGVVTRSQVTFTQEEFGIREYDTFSLPSGIYESLRVELGEAQGKNWWCVVFPALCHGATQEDFKVTAVAGGFGDTLTNTLTQDSGYEIRFFFLDCFGKLENFFHRT